MSSNLEFHLVEWKPQQWYWIRQSGSCPREYWDWREEDPDVVGPFASKEKLLESYARYEYNTGGSTTFEHDPKLHQDDVLAQLINEAVSPAERYKGYVSVSTLRRPYRG